MFEIISLITASFHMELVTLLLLIDLVPATDRQWRTSETHEEQEQVFNILKQQLN